MSAAAILKLPELPPDPKDGRIYDLNPLRERNFQFVFDVGSGIQSVAVKKLRLSSRIKKGDRITVEADASGNPHAIYDLLDQIGKSLPLYSIDSAMIRQLVDSATTADIRYTPSNARREARKLDTKGLHESWQKEYRALKKHRPGMSDVWYSQQIATDGHCQESQCWHHQKEHETLRNLGSVSVSGLLVIRPEPRIASRRYSMSALTTMCSPRSHPFRATVLARCPFITIVDTVTSAMTLRTSD